MRSDLYKLFFLFNGYLSLLTLGQRNPHDINGGYREVYNNNNINQNNNQNNVIQDNNQDNVIRNNNQNAVNDNVNQNNVIHNNNQNKVNSNVNQDNNQHTVNSNVNQNNNQKNVNQKTVSNNKVNNNNVNQNRNINSTNNQNMGNNGNKQNVNNPNNNMKNKNVNTNVNKPNNGNNNQNNIQNNNQNNVNKNNNQNKTNNQKVTTTNIQNVNQNVNNNNVNRNNVNNGNVNNVNSNVIYRSEDTKPIEPVYVYNQNTNNSISNIKTVPTNNNPPILNNASNTGHIPVNTGNIPINKPVYIGENIAPDSENIAQSGPHIPQNNQNSTQNVPKNTSVKPATSRRYEATRVLLSKHSFATPFDNTKEWNIMKAAIPSPESFILLPGINDREGIISSKTALMTTTFDFEMDFFVKGLKSISDTEGFGVWYTLQEPQFIKENKFSSPYTDKGLGVIFEINKKNDKITPKISFISIIDGELEYIDGIIYDFRNSIKPISFKLTVINNTIKGLIRKNDNNNHNNWITCFTIDSTRIGGIHESGYISMSAKNPKIALNKNIINTTRTDGNNKLHEYDKHVDMRAIDGNKTFDTIGIYNLYVHNLDFGQVGEEIGTTYRDLSDGSFESNDYMYENNIDSNDRENWDNIGNNYDGKYGQNSSLNNLSNMLYKHIKEQSPREKSILNTLNVLNNTIIKLVAEIRELKQGFDKQNKSQNIDSSDELVKGMKTELVGLRHMFSKHSQNHENTLQSLSTKVDTHLNKNMLPSSSTGHMEEIQNLSHHALLLEKSISTQSHTHLFIGITVFSAIFAFALFVWKKFKDMEKKHFL